MQTQIIQLGTLSSAVNEQITQAVSSTTASAATATAAASTATAEAGIATAQAAIATEEAAAAAASAVSSAAAAAVQFTSYTAFRAFTGTQAYCVVNAPGIAGEFGKLSSAAGLSDNGGTIIFDANGNAWQRLGIGSSVSPFWFGAVGNGTANDATELVAADAAANLLGVFLDGNFATFAVGSLIALGCGNYRNFTLVPTSAYAGFLTGNAPYLNVNSVSGVCYCENASANGFGGSGVNVRRNGFTGQPVFRTRGFCSFTNNGTNVYTTLTAQVDTASAFILPVASSAGFLASSVIYLGGDQYTVLSTTTGSITLVNNGTSATLVSGSNNTYPVGCPLSITRTGQNGLTVGDGGAAFSLDIPPGTLYLQNNASAGFFNWSGSYAGVQNVQGVQSYNNGFIGIGLGYVNEGDVSKNICFNNVNNGLDMFETKGAVKVHHNLCRFNGVNGIFAGGNGQIAEIAFNDLFGNCLQNLNMFGRTALVIGATCIGNDLRNGFYNGIATQGIKNLKCASNKFGGTCIGQSAQFYGSSTIGGFDKITLENNDFYPLTGGGTIDVTANGGNFGVGATTAGILQFTNNDFIDHDPVTTCVAVDSVDGQHFPSSYLTVPAGYTLTTTHGSVIAVTAELFQIENTSTLKSEPALCSFYLTTSGLYANPATLTAATRIVGFEFSNDGTQFWGAFRGGQYGYNFMNANPTTVYALIKSGGMTRIVKMVWT